MRKPHFLSHNKGGELPREVVVMDTETVPVPLGEGRTGHELHFGWAMYARRHRGGRWSAAVWHRFTTPGEFWSWALRRVRPRARLTIYCHNAEFDAQVVHAFDELLRRKWRVVTACLEGPPTIIKWRRGKRTVQWLDTLNLWRVPLKVIGEKVNLPKLSMPATWGDVEKDDAYCKRDVEIVWRALIEWWRFLAENDLGNAAATLAGQAFSTYRHRFMDTPIFIDANEQALGLARAAYLGGRCEAFRLGLVDEAGLTLDVNSMYPDVMRKMQVPVQLLTVRTMATMQDLERYLEKYLVIADVELRTEEPAYPHIVGGRLCFPVGEFRQTLATPELRYALAQGAVRKLHAVAIYQGAPAFKRFMEWGWEQRQIAKATGAPMLAEQSKRLINAFYGKWGQRGRVWEVIAQSPESRVCSMSSFDLDAGRWRKLRQLGHAVQEQMDKGESMNSHPAIAAHITSEARLVLWQLIKRAGADSVWYCDTDSIKGPARLARELRDLIRPRELGGLKVEERFPWIDIRGCKDYRTPAHDVHKGVRAGAETADDIAYLQVKWQGWAGAIARGRLDMPVTEDVVKVLSRDYSKGTVGPGGRVSPLRLRLGE